MVASKIGWESCNIIQESQCCECNIELYGPMVLKVQNPAASNIPMLWGKKNQNSNAFVALYAVKDSTSSG